jgi:PAS domain S-box-containing protein
MIGFTSATRLSHSPQPSQALRPYTAVLIATALAAAALFWLQDAGHPAPDVPALLVPVLLGACLGGFPAGLFAMGLGVVVDGVLFRDFSLGLASLAELGPRSPLVAYGAAGLLLSLVGHWLRRAGQRNREVLEKQQSLEQEIARRRRLEEALVRSQRTVQAQLAEIEGIYATAPVGLALVDRELRFVRVNRQWSEISGPAPEAHVGRFIQDAMPRLGESLAVFADKVCLTGESVLEREIRCGSASDAAGERVWLASFVPLASEAGGEGGVTIAIRDITEQKRFEGALRESEEKYRQLTEWSPHCIWMTDPAGSLVYANRHWHEFTGLSLESAKGRGWLSMVHPATGTGSGRNTSAPSGTAPIWRRNCGSAPSAPANTAGTSWAPCRCGAAWGCCPVGWWWRWTCIKSNPPNRRSGPPRPVCCWPWRRARWRSGRRARPARRSLGWTRRTCA